ncbi:MAG: hypothetical protein NTW95_06400 [Candidatus Aminicenantes bacterium]|nr:hypothetical protein [Candidatus Aminicenantes bacterium]
MIGFSKHRLLPEPESVYAALGMRADTEPALKVTELLNRALEIYKTLSEARDVLEPISKSEFAALYSGQGLNAPETPLGLIFPRAERLLLFAFTLGAAISREIERLFKSNDFALASMLDTVASLAADNAGREAESWVARQGGADQFGTHFLKVLLYSPGYCGWHISGQKKLFEFLRPERIDIHLNERFLMIPLKSISGVLVAGAADIHQIAERYPFCDHCQSPACRERGMARAV